MDSIRVTAKTVEDAITEASIQLGTSSDNIEYTIIEKGTSGFFGIGGKKAVIEAKRKFTDEDLMKEVFGDPSAKEKKEEKREVRKEAKKENRETREFREEKKEGKKEVKKDKKDFKKDKKEIKKEEKREEKREEKKEQAKEQTAAFTKETAKPSAPAKEPEKKPAAEAPKKMPAEDAAKNTADEAVKDAAKEAEQPKEPAAPRQPKVPANPEEVRRKAETFLNDVFRTMDMKVEIHTSFEEEVLSVDLVGDDMGILIGKRGQTLDSLQYLTSLVVNKGKASYVRVKLDTEDYRNRRKATLENLAKNIAFKVKKTRRPVFLEPMNPYERRIIHSALQNDPYVTTHSEGDEPCRKVVVTLKKK